MPMEASPFSQGVMLLEAFRTVVLDAYFSRLYAPELFLTLTLNQVLISMFIPFGEISPKTCTHAMRARVHEASDAESDRVPFPPSRRRWHC